jgi:hypothetical protein
MNIKFTRGNASEIASKRDGLNRKKDKNIIQYATEMAVPLLIPIFDKPYTTRPIINTINQIAIKPSDSNRLKL